MVKSDIAKPDIKTWHSKTKHGEASRNAWHSKASALDTVSSARELQAAEWQVWFLGTVESVLI